MRLRTTRLRAVEFCLLYIVHTTYHFSRIDEFRKGMSYYSLIFLTQHSVSIRGTVVGGIFQVRKKSERNAILNPDILLIIVTFVFLAHNDIQGSPS